MKNTPTRRTKVILCFLLSTLMVFGFILPVSAETVKTPIRTVMKVKEKSVVKTIDKIPLFNQMDYEMVPYGDYGTVASHGCGIVSVAMIATYLTDTIHAPDYLAVQFADYNTDCGSYWCLFQESAEELGLPFVKSDSENGEWYDWDIVKDALSNKQPVVCLQKKGLFTGGGHYIVLSGITEEGLIMVNDPNGYNWFKNQTMMDGYKNGFTEEQITENAVAYWIYGEKVSNTELPLPVK